MIPFWSAYLCYGLQSQSPTAPHLYAYVGMDCNPRVQGTQGRTVATPSQEEPNWGFGCNTPFQFFFRVRERRVCNMIEAKMDETRPHTLETMRKVARKMVRHKSTTREIFGFLRDVGTMVLTKIASPAMRQVALSQFCEVLIGLKT